MSVVDGGVPRPAGLEVLGNLLLGAGTEKAGLEAAPGTSFASAFERAVLPALEREPCVVSFSGGRDSSLVLMLALAVAREHGLPEPLPVTMRYPDAEETEEAGWQELVLSSLGIRDREILTLTSEQDALGPAARDALLRHGLLWPANAYMHAPVIGVARGGSVLTGAGGDELLGGRADRRLLLLAGRVRPRGSDARLLVSHALPQRSKVRRRARRARARPWLTAAGAWRLAEAQAADEISYPLSWSRGVDHWHRSRAYDGLSTSLGLLGGDADVHLTHPLLDPGVMATIRDAGGRLGFRSRTDAMRRLGGAGLPERLVRRESKATFSAPFWGPAARAFVEDLTDAGLDEDLVDVEALVHEWRRPHPSYETALMLHAAWLSSSGAAR